MEDAAMTPRLILGPDEAMMQFNNVFANGQAQTQAVSLTYQARINTMKTVENALQLIGGNTLTLITDTYFQHVLQSGRCWHLYHSSRNRLCPRSTWRYRPHLRHRSYHDTDCPAFWRILYGIIQQVVQHFAQAARIG